MIVVLAPINVETFAVSKTVLKKLVAPTKFMFPVVSVDDNLAPVIEASTMLLALIDVKPNLSPVTAPVIIFCVDTDPSEGIEALAPKPKNITSTLFVPNGGASENTRVELLDYMSLFVDEHHQQRQ